MEKYILVLDIGSTNVKASLIDKASNVFSSASSEFPIQYPEEGLVEESATVIWGTTVEMIRKVMTKSGIAEEQIASIGITNQREAFVVWDKKTGLPVYNAIGWQDKRGVPKSNELLAAGEFGRIYQQTGQFLNNFMPTAGKLTWVLDNVAGVRERAEKGELLFGNFDAWIIWNLTDGKSHCTDVSNASRTMYFDINTLQWDDQLLALFGVPKEMLPTVKPSGGLLGEATGLFHRPIPIMSAIGDAHAATFGQRCFTPGMMKATYGSTCVMMVNIGDKPILFPGLGLTIGWQIAGKVTYLFEGGFYIAGLAMKWLRDVMQLAGDFVTMDNIAQNTQRTDGLYVCPAFMGTATPTFNGAAKGIVSGLGITNGPNDIIKATLDSLAYTTKDCVETFKAGLPTELRSVAVDGGVTNSDYIMQLVADMTRLEVVRAKNVEATTLGAAYIAGLACGFWANIEDIEANLPDNRTVFTPKMNQEESDALYSGWQKTVGAALKLTE